MKAARKVYQRQAFSKAGRLLVASLVLYLSLKTFPANAAQAKSEPVPTSGLVFRDAHYDGKLTDEEARFTAEFTAESLDSLETRQLLLEGEVALVTPKLPTSLRVERKGNQYWLMATKRGQYQVKLEWVARITRAEPWNQVAFPDPPLRLHRSQPRAKTWRCNSSAERSWNPSGRMGWRE